MRGKAKIFLLIILASCMMLAFTACGGGGGGNSYVDAEMPTVQIQGERSRNVDIGTVCTFSVTASVSDGGTLTYQWIRYIGGVSETIEGATDSSYEATIEFLGWSYYSVMVTNTNNEASGNKTAVRESDHFEIGASEAEHVHSLEWIVVQEATCLDGLEERSCISCGEITSFRSIPAIPNFHEYEWVTVSAATCTTEGEEIEVCKYYDGHRRDSRPIGELGHDLVWITTKTAVCEDAGQRHQECSRCDMEEAAEEIAALVHEYTWTTTTTASCNAAGLESEQCNKCGDIKSTRAITKLEHTAGDWVAVSTVACDTDGSKKKSCIYCSFMMETGILGHTYQWKTVTNATCQETGEQKNECSNCQHVSGTRMTDIISHNPSGWFASPPATCTSAGEQEKHCTMCLTNLETEVLPQLVHNYGWTTITAATCTSEGVESYRCSRCHDTTDTRAISTTAHSGQWVSTLAATCENKGERESRCTHCSLVLLTEEVAALGHDYVWTVTVAASNKAPAIWEKVCSRNAQHKTDDPKYDATELVIGTASASISLEKGEFAWYKFVVDADKTPFELTPIRTAGSGYLFAYLYQGDEFDRYLIAAYDASSEYYSRSSATRGYGNKVVLDKGTYYIKLNSSGVIKATGSVTIKEIEISGSVTLGQAMELNIPVGETAWFRLEVLESQRLYFNLNEIGEDFTRIYGVVYEIEKFGAVAWIGSGPIRGYNFAVGVYYIMFTQGSHDASQPHNLLVETFEDIGKSREEITLGEQTGKTEVKTGEEYWLEFSLDKDTTVLFEMLFEDVFGENIPTQVVELYLADDFSKNLMPEDGLTVRLEAGTYYILTTDGNGRSGDYYFDLCIRDADNG